MLAQVGLWPVADLPSERSHADRLRALLESAGFQNIEISRQANRLKLPSFDAYFGPFERWVRPLAKPI
jgi:hypothetical protein